MLNKDKITINFSKPILLRIAWFFVLLLLVLILGFLFQRIYKQNKYSKPPISAKEFYLIERDFIEKYAKDNTEGGYLMWVDKDGSIKDSRKFSIFQANIILWLGGLQVQHPDEKNLTMIKHAGDYLVKYLYKGKGEWLEYDERKHRKKQDFFWNPRSEVYISYALMNAYLLTNEKRYLDIALETTAAQRDKNPDAKIFADHDKNLEIGFRFPEHMGHYQEYLITKNEEALKFARRLDANYRGKFGKEILSQDGFDYYYHGTAIIDQLLYGFLDNNQEAYDDAVIGRNFYFSMNHDDEKLYNPDVPGEAADNGRDYYDKRMAMNLISWSKDYNSNSQNDAVDTWEEIKMFWDFAPPYGFLVNLAEGRKTCFAIGIPQFLMDLTGPALVSYKDEAKGLFNHQAEVVLQDTSFNWNSYKFRGIGVAPKTFKIKVPLGKMYGNFTIKEGECDGCIKYQFNYFSFFPGTAKVSAEDFFGNRDHRNVSVSIGPVFSGFDNLNILSRYYYMYIGVGAILFIDITLLLFILLPDRYFVRNKEIYQKSKKIKD